MINEKTYPLRSLYINNFEQGIGTSYTGSVSRQKEILYTRLRLVWGLSRNITIYI